MKMRWSETLLLYITVVIHTEARWSDVEPNPLLTPQVHPDIIYQLDYIPCRKSVIHTVVGWKVKWSWISC